MTQQGNSLHIVVNHEVWKQVLNELFPTLLFAKLTVYEIATWMPRKGIVPKRLSASAAINAFGEVAQNPRERASNPVLDGWRGGGDRVMLIDGERALWCCREVWRERRNHI